MSNSMLKSSLLSTSLKTESSSLSNSILTSKFPSTSLSIKSSIQLTSNLTSTVGSFSNLSQKAKLTTDNSINNVKKLKLTEAETLLAPKQNLNQNLTSNLSTASLSTKLTVSKTLTSHSGLSQKNNLLNTLKQEPARPVKRPHIETNLADNHQTESFLEDEYLKTDKLINQLNDELKEIEKEFERNRKSKLSKKTRFLDNSKLLDNTEILAIRYKNALINTVCSSLLREPNFKNQYDPTRNLILNLSNSVIEYDPEFILKLALYTRKELNIRVTANFLLCLASFKDKCRPFLQRYFKNSIVLPSDWIDVAEQYQLFVDKRLNFGALPSALRKSMVEKFPDFDRYQLAKYNKEKSRLAKNNELKDVKHVKAKLKDEDGKVTETIEHKYIKQIKEGLKINDHIIFELVYTEECESLKFDIINRQETPVEISKAFRKSTKKDVKSTRIKAEANDVVACRISVDFEHKKLMVKNFLNKQWTKYDTKVNMPANIFQSNVALKFYIEVNSIVFKFGIFKDEQKIDLLSYPHIKHRIELFKLNLFRLSGTHTKLKKLEITSEEKMNADVDPEETETKIKQRSFTLKQLIRQLHISSPVDNVMSLLGKKYPLNFEEFIQTKLPGIFDSEKAGKRMKLETPETWETQISLKGNKAEVWEQLIDNKKLPYMAMLRNLRNMIKTGISKKHHQWVIKKIQDEGAVIHSKQFPFRFFTAYEVLDELEEEHSNYLKWCENPIKDKKKINTDIKYDPSLLKRYKTALDNALKVATTFNVSPIQGRSVIVLNLSQEMDVIPGRAGKSLGKRVTSISEMAALLALMFKYSCEDSKLIIYANSQSYTDIQLEQGTILDNMKSLTELKNLTSSTKEDTLIPRKALLNLFTTHQEYDNLIYLSNGIRDVNFFKEFLRKYRADKNENLMFVNVNLATDTVLLAQDPNFDHENDINISGFSDAILRFVAERGNKGQLIHIENIDKAYELPVLVKNVKIEEKKIMEIDRPRLKVYVPKSEFKTLKVFISSTFRDMHSERDILTRTVFPLLRSKLSSLLINIYEIDLRWGITESEAESNQTLDLCLNQVLNSDYFINMLGSRYGHVLDNYSVRKNPQLEWLNSYAKNASITELEIETQLRKIQHLNTKYERTFFYFRDSAFLNKVPGKYLSHFVDDNEENYEKLKNLKSKLKNSNFEIYDGYKCNWLKCEEFPNGASRALVCNLEPFAHRVFNNLFNSISKHYKNKVDLIELDEIGHFNNLTEAYMRLNSESFIGREKLLGKLEKLVFNKIEKSCIKVLLLNGEPGSGKTSFISYFLTKSTINHKFVHLVGAYPSSEFISLFLKRFCVSINRIYNFGVSEQDLDSSDYEFYKKMTEQFLTKLSEDILKDDEKFYVIIDSIDFMVDDNKNLDYSFDWLPETITSKIVLVFTARSESPIQNILNKISINNTRINKLKIDTLEIESLEVLDKSEFIKSKLAKYNKYLDENPFNNQIKMLTTKKDSVNPLYLNLVCEELRTHNQYETLNQKLREIPMRINLLLNYVLERLEADFGSEFVSLAFNLICASRDGLNEHELKSIINLYFRVKNLNLLDKFSQTNSLINLDNSFKDQVAKTRGEKDEVSTSKFLSFLESISETFLKPRSKTDESLIQIRYNHFIENSLRTKYGSNLNTKISIKLTNRLMALYYMISMNYRSLIYLPFHLIQSEIYEDLVYFATQIPILALKCELGLVNEIMNDFDLHQDLKFNNILVKNLNSKKPNKVNSDIQKNSSRFQDYKSFIHSNYHLLSANPGLIYQQIMNQHNDSIVLNDLKHFLNTNPNYSIGNLIEWLNKEKQTDALKIYPVVIKDFDDYVSCISLSFDGSLVACGTRNCQIRLFSTSTAKLIRNFQGHSSSINSIKFIGNDVLCSTSSDGKICLWNVNDGFRIKILDKHNGHVVRDSCSDSKGENLVTVGWDCSAKIWNPRTGSLEGELKDHPRPINCVTFNPDGTMVATGCWDSCIRLFNFYDRSRKAVLRGHQTSVRSIGFSFNGVYLASASIDGEVKLWNSKFGSQIGTLIGHSMPVNSIRFSPNSPYLITGSTDRRIKVWSGTIGKMIRVIDSQTKKPLTSVTFYKKTGEYFAVGTHEGDILVYEINGVLRNKFKSHDSYITRIKFSSDGKFLVSSCNDGKVIITDISEENLTYERARLKEHSKSVNALAINEYNVIITGSEDCAVRIYPNIMDKIDEIKSNSIEESPFLTLNEHTSPLTAVSFNSSGDKFASSSKDALIIVWNINHINYQISELYRINSAHLDWITDLEWSNSSEFILTSSNDNTLKIWNAENGSEKCVLTGHSSNINSCSFQYGCAVSTGYDGSIKIWSHKGHEISTLLGHQGRVNSCDLFVKVRHKEPVNLKNNENDSMEISSSWGEQVEKELWMEKHKNKVIHKEKVNIDDVYLVTCSDDSTIRIWKPIESDYLLSLENNSESVNSVDIDGNLTISTASSDKTVQLWNVKNFFNNVKTGKLVSTNEPNKTHRSEILSMAFDEKKEILLSCSFDGIVIMWQIVYSGTNGKKFISNIKYVQEVHAHEKSCNSICILSEENEALYFSTSSEQSIKVWRISKKCKEFTSSIELVQNLVKNLNQIVYMDILNEGANQKCLLTVEYESFKLLIRKNRIKNNLVELTGACICVLGFQSLIYNILLKEKKLFVTVPHDELFIFDLSNTGKKMEMINLNCLKDSDKKIVNIIRSVPNNSWYCSVETNGQRIYTGDSGGSVFYHNSNNLERLKSIHDSKITNLIAFSNREKVTRFISSDKEGVIKIWNDNFDNQLGQFNNSSSITVMKQIKSNDEIIFVFGDKMGNLNLIKWYD